VSLQQKKLTAPNICFQAELLTWYSQISLSCTLHLEYWAYWLQKTHSNNFSTELQVKINEGCIVGVQLPVHLKFTKTEVQTFTSVVFIPLEQLKYLVWFTAVCVFLNEIENISVIFEESFCQLFSCYLNPFS
jgi:hypothetical protein